LCADQIQPPCPAPPPIPSFWLSLFSFWVLIFKIIFCLFTCSTILSWGPLRIKIHMLLFIRWILWPVHSSDNVSIWSLSLFCLCN
jgi:hypothetical protein